MNQSVQPLTDEQLFCLNGCRGYPQYHKMRSGFEKGHCVFCDPHREWHKILYGDEYWVVWKNPFQRTDLQHEFVIASTLHIRYLEEIAPMAWKRLYSMIETINKKIDSENGSREGGMLFIRFGDMRYNSGSVPHLHGNYWVPNGRSAVSIPLVKSEEHETRNKARAAEFALRYEASEQP